MSNKENMDKKNYAVIATGGKQYTVEEGQELNIELLNDAKIGDKVSLAPVMVCNNGNTIASKSELEKCSVEAEVISYARGEKIRGFTYKAKARVSKRWGHRQTYHTVKIVGIKG